MRTTGSRPLCQGAILVGGWLFALMGQSVLLAKIGVDNERTQKKSDRFTIVVGIFTILNVG